MIIKNNKYSILEVGIDIIERLNLPIPISIWAKQEQFIFLIRKNSEVFTSGGEELLYVKNIEDIIYPYLSDLIKNKQK